MLVMINKNIANRWLFEAVMPVGFIGYWQFDLGGRLGGERIDDVVSFHEYLPSAIETSASRLQEPRKLWGRINRTCSCTPLLAHRTKSNEV